MIFFQGRKGLEKCHAGQVFATNLRFLQLVGLAHPDLSENMEVVSLAKLFPSQNQRSSQFWLASKKAAPVADSRWRRNMCITAVSGASLDSRPNRTNKQQAQSTTFD